LQLFDFCSCLPLQILSHERLDHSYELKEKLAALGVSKYQSLIFKTKTEATFALEPSFAACVLDRVDGDHQHEFETTVAACVKLAAEFPQTFGVSLGNAAEHEDIGLNLWTPVFMGSNFYRKYAVVDVDVEKVNVGSNVQVGSFSRTQRLYLR